MVTHPGERLVEILPKLGRNSGSMDRSLHHSSARYTIWRALVALLSIVMLSTVTLAHMAAVVDPTFAAEVAEAGDH
jgi:hypothetical protein